MPNNTKETFTREQEAQLFHALTGIRDHPTTRVTPRKLTEGQSQSIAEAICLAALEYLKGAESK